MTDAACPVSGTFAPVEDRRQVVGIHLCNRCFPETDEVADLPDDWSLVRTVAPHNSTVHRDAADGDVAAATHGGNEAGDTAPWTALSDMDPDEFDREVLGSESP